MASWWDACIPAEQLEVSWEAPTGNARCLNYHYAPIVRMTNTWIERGKRQ